MNKQDPTNNGKGYINCSTLEELRQLTRFTPVTNKRPYLKQWQNNPKTLAYCENEIKNGRANGYGLITGNGLLAIDFDGGNAHQIAKNIAHWLVEINTLAWTSGKPSRKQILIIIPSHRLKDFEKLSRKALSCFGDVEAVENEQLEIRYNRCQSVLPPSAHPETKGYYWLSESEIKIVELNDYQCNTILSALDTDTISNTKKYHGLTNSQQKLTLIESALEFIPNDNYFDWILVGMAIKDGGYDCSLWNSWSSHSTKYKIGECDKTWQSFNGTGTTIRTLFWLAKQHGFNQKQWYRDNLPPFINTHNIRHNLDKNYEKSSNEVNELDISKLIDDLVNRLAKPELSEAKRKLEITKFVSLYRVSSSIIEKAIDEKIREFEREDSFEETREKVNEILLFEKSELNLFEILPHDIAKNIVAIAKALNATPEHLFTVLLVTWASAIGTNSNVMILKKTKYKQPCIIRAMIVANSGDRKSPIIDIGTDFVETLEYQYQDYAKEQYRKELADYNALSEEEQDKIPEPEEPPEPRLIVKDINHDGLVRIHCENPEGLLMIVDELNGYFARMNKFNVRGDDKDKDLELFNGKSIRKDRMTKEYSYHIKKTAVSIIGSIQWDVLESLRSEDINDSSGRFARWLVCVKPLPPAYLDLNDDDDTLFDEYEQQQMDLYRYLRNVNTDLGLSQDAKDIFQFYQHYLEDLRQSEGNNNLRTAYPKLESYLARIAMVLHCIWSRYEGELTPVVSGKIMTLAMTVIEFYHCQEKLLLTMIADKNSDLKLTGDILKIRNLLNKKGSLSVREVKRCIRHLDKVKDGDDMIKDCFKILIDKGLAKDCSNAKTQKITKP